MPTPRIRAARWGLIWLTAFLLLLTGASFAYNTNAINRVRGNFCTWAVVHRTEVRSLPPTPARVAIAADDQQLIDQLGC